MKKPTEAEIAKLMTSLRCSRAEAIEVWECDNDILENEEQEQLDSKARKVKVDHNCGNTNKGKSKTHVVKVSEEKKGVFDAVVALAETLGTSAKVITKDKRVAVLVNGKCFTIDVIENRKSVF